MERGVLAAAMFFIIVLLALTIYSTVTSGLEPLTALAALVLLLLGVGLFGALRESRG